MLLSLRSLLEVAAPALRDANQAAGKSVTISVVAGDAIWIGFVVAGAVDLSTSCADTAGGGTNAYSVDAALDGNSGWSMYSFHAVAKATETIIVTITNPYTASARTFYHVEAGCASVGLVDGAAVTNLDGAAVTTHPSANLTTTNPNDVIISFWVQADVGTTISENGTGFTRRITQGGMGTFDKVVTSNGTYNESVISTVATVYGSILIAFKAAPTSISGSGGTVQAIQTFAGTGTCAAPLSGNGGTTQAIQTIAGSGTCAGVAPLTGTGATVQAVQTINGSGTCYAAPLTGTGATVQAIQAIAGVGTCQIDTRVPLVKAAVNGIFDGARVKLERVFMPTWGDTGPGSVVLFEGNVAACDPSSTAVKLTIKSELERLNTVLPRYLYQPACGHVLYGAGCGISRAAWTVSGTVLAGATTTTLPSARGEATGYFNLGVLVMTSGAAMGSRRSVRAFSGGAFTLALPLPVAPAPGDTFTVYPGCDHSLGASGCARFSNQNRYRGFPNVPRSETAR